MITSLGLQVGKSTIFVGLVSVDTHGTLSQRWDVCVFLRVMEEVEEEEESVWAHQ